MHSLFCLHISCLVTISTSWWPPRGTLMNKSLDWCTERSWQHPYQQRGLKEASSMASSACLCDMNTVTRMHHWSRLCRMLCPRTFPRLRAFGCLAKRISANTNNGQLSEEKCHRSWTIIESAATASKIDLYCIVELSVHLARLVYLYTLMLFAWRVGISQ
jgi:hypothetical protein